MPMNIPLPTKAKITAFVCNGRTRPKVVNWRFRFASGQNSCTAASKPADIPTIAQITVAMEKARTIRLSYLKVSTFIIFAGLGFRYGDSIFSKQSHGRRTGIFELARPDGPDKGRQKERRDH